jgi:hypothetical protein
MDGFPPSIKCKGHRPDDRFMAGGFNLAMKAGLSMLRSGGNFATLQSEFYPSLKNS